MLDGHVGSEYWSTGLVIDMEPTRFTALASLILVRRLSASRFRRRHFPSTEFAPISECEQRGLVPVAGHEYFRHEKFDGSTSRKGFLVSEWCVDGHALSHVNVHLFHDDSNLLALASTPSTYATKRSAALRVVMQRLPPGPALLAGDFNFRLDLAGFVAWLRAQVPSSASASMSMPASDGQYVLVQKDTFQCPFLDPLLCDAAKHTSIRESYDMELQRFNGEVEAALRLQEDAVGFPPTYPVDGLGKWSSKRAPAWCDRVLYTQSCTPLFSASHKRSYAVLQATPSTPLGSDHLPVYFHFNASPL
jgi:inositol-1,4,5-trisphosphate 5-phosphatase